MNNETEVVEEKVKASEESHEESAAAVFSLSIKKTSDKLADVEANIEGYGNDLINMLGSAFLARPDLYHLVKEAVLAVSIKRMLNPEDGGEKSNTEG